MSNIFDSPKKLYEALNNNGYICDKDIPLIIYLAYKLNKAILLQGEPGCGKTEVAKQISKLLNNDDPIRLQCYDSLSKEDALYSWDYQKQLLYIEANKEKQNWQELEDDLYSDKFISPRALYKSIISLFISIKIIFSMLELFFKNSFVVSTAIFTALSNG